MVHIVTKLLLLITRLMKKITIKTTIILKLITLGLLISTPTQAFAKINIFACEPEWESLAQEIGGNKVKIKAATNSYQDPHHIRARPSLIVSIRNADLLFCSGMGLESGWLPILMANGTAQIQPNNIGFFMAGDYVKALEIPEHLDRKFGDIHAFGNPHIHLNPHNITIIAKQLTKKLKVIDEKNKLYYQQRFRQLFN